MSENKHMTSIGGQAVIEGVMMRGPSKSAIAIRKSDGEIDIDIKNNSSLVAKLKLTQIPIIRGVVAFFDSLITGVGATMHSAEFIDLEEESEPSESKFDKFIEKHFGDKALNIVLWFSVALSLVIGVGLFMLLPTAIAGGVKSILLNETFIKFPAAFVSSIEPFMTNHIVLNLLEASARMLIFVLYMVLVSKLKDMQRVFEYHGAEHKTIACYEAGEELTVENAKKHLRFHPRCGTSFLLIVMLVSILFFSFLTWENVWMRMGLRLLLLPVVAGFSYELIKFAGKSRLKIVCALTKPGLWMQRLTTREPDESQLEVAIASLKAVMPEDGEDDRW